MPEPTAELTQRVQRGATLLDARRPGWDALIDLDKLYLNDAALCVLGQTYGWYWIGERALFGDDEERFNGAVEHGFNDRSLAKERDALEAEWRRLIESRRTAGQEATDVH